MQIHHETLAETTRFLANEKSLGEREGQYQNYLKLIRKAHPVDASTRMLEVGTGTGWFPLMCKMRGLSCKGLEISPQLIEAAFATGRAYGVEPDIQLGNIEDTDLGEQMYDVVVAACVFEHIEHWVPALEKIHAVLKPGGAFFFISTNKFYFGTNEYPWMFYGWLPNRLRYRFRVWKSGPDIMKLGVDFNQFRHWQLRREFRRLGFRKAFDRIDLANPADYTGKKKFIVNALKALGPVGKLALTFADATLFVCVK